MIPHESGNDDVKSNGWESLGKVKQQQQPASNTKCFQGFCQKKRAGGFIELINRLKRIYHHMPPQNQLTLTDQESYYYLFV